MIRSKTPPLNILRGILRQLKVTADKPNLQNNSAIRKYVIEQYRASQKISSQEKVDQLQKLAWDFFMLKQDMAERERLHKLDAGVEVKLSPKEMSRRAAARAGLRLPDLNPDLENS
jgi:hypothetical protein